MDSKVTESKRILVIGAGPAGLTAAWSLMAQKDHEVVILESSNDIGGISKTVISNGWRFDLGGHRFFSKSEVVNDLWREMLDPIQFLIRPRKSRIYYNKKYFDYPLKPINALRNLGIRETLRCILSFLLVKIRPPVDDKSFENWVAARFGWRLYRIFFKTYTEKVWGISTKKLQSTWAAQRIKNLSLGAAIRNALFPGRGRVLTTLIDRFLYPPLGPGQLWESAARKLVDAGCTLYFNEEVTQVRVTKDCYLVETTTGRIIEAHAVFSSAPLASLPKLLNASKEIQEYGGKLKFRDFLIVALPIKITQEIFDDNWIYIHDPSVKVGRIQNYGSWSPEMVKEGSTCLGMEYFVNRGDSFWNLGDHELVELALNELKTVGFDVSLSESSGYVVRVEKAYPVYDEEYLESVDKIKVWLHDQHPRWFQIGRNGQHRYNNQDHSMLTSIKSVEKFLGDEKADPWNVNLDDDYHEISNSTREAPIFQNND
jgi:protoporphyrinogen oxidase